MAESKEQSIHSNPQFKLHIAIDFGTDGVGLAYAYHNEIFVHSKWSSKKYGDQIKPKTLILLDKEDEILAFGLDAKFTYMAVASQRNEWNLFERFKMSLYETPKAYDQQIEVIEEHKQNKPQKNKQKIKLKETLTATNGHKVSTEKVFIAAFKHLESEALKFLKKKKIKDIDNSEIQWIITVPAIWNDTAKYKMKGWAVRAGLIDPKIPNQCKIVYEPDCASLAIRYHIQAHKTANKQNSNYFGIGDRYILVDAGGGTVDICCHEILNGFAVKEMVYPSGGPWGSCFIDDQYIKLLKSIFSTRWINEFKLNNADIYVELTNNFQCAKATFYENILDTEKHDDMSDNKVHHVRLPTDFVCFIEEKLEHSDIDKNIDDMISDYASMIRSKLELNDEYLEISHMIWKIMFDCVINPTVNHIKKLLKTETIQNNVQYLCLVGGLSCSKYYQFRMKEEFGLSSKYKLNIIVPVRPILSVVEGAAYFGIKADYIQSRKLRYTYGKAANVKLATAQRRQIPLEYIEQNKYYNQHRKRYKVRNVFDVFVSKEEEIKFGQVYKGKQHRHNTSSTHTTIKILCSDLKDPKVKSDGKEIARLRIDFDEDNDEEEVGIELCFWDTIIKVFAYSIATPHIKKELKIDYSIVNDAFVYTLDNTID
eukprot:38221_1